MVRVGLEVVLGKYIKVAAILLTIFYSYLGGGYRGIEYNFFIYVPS